MLIFAILAAYFIIILIYVALYFFIVYHLAKYMLSASLNRILLPVFIIVSALLLVSNIMLFFSVDWRELVTKVSL